MALDVEVRLTDAVGAATVGGGTWQLVVRNNGAQVHDSGVVAYTGTVLSATAPVAAWSHVAVTVTPARYAPVAVELNPSASGSYRDDTLVVIRRLDAAAAKVDLPVLRIREAVGESPPGPPKLGSPLVGPWLATIPRTTRRVYRELLVTPWLAKRPDVRSVTDSGRAGPLGDPDQPDWDRFNTRRRAADPATSGAPLLLEYGEVGSSSAAGPRFLVGIWAPVRLPGAGTPTWRDVVAFIHPSTAKTWFPPVAFPFRPLYPYAVGDNTNVPQGDPDRTYQPYVNLAMRYLIDAWVPYELAGNEAIFVTPVFPNPVPKHPDDLEYGLPFRTPAGLARLLLEVNLFLHRIRYGHPGETLDRWWGAATSSPPHSSSVDARAPALRRVAVAAYSASTTQLDALLRGEQLSNMRYPVDAWSVPAAALDQFDAAWRETWCLDMLTGATTVAAATFERHLLDWVNRRSGRRFVMGGSGTTGHDDPDRLYPSLAKASTAITVQSTTEPRRHARMWREAGGKWLGMFCTNAYLSAATAQPGIWPPMQAAPSDDDAHGFMFHIASGLAFGWTAVGTP